jgi:hypothetical protein
LGAKFSFRIRAGLLRNDNNISFTSKMGTVGTDSSESATLCKVGFKKSNL